MVSRGRNDSRPRYHHHRAIDDAKGVVTAVETTPGSVTENRKLLDLIEQHETNTGSKIGEGGGRSQVRDAGQLRRVPAARDQHAPW